MTIDQLIDDFEFLDDWEERYRHVIELGKALAPLAPEEHNDATKVSGCASQVWFVCEPAEEPAGALIFRGESDAHIVQGLIAILTTLYSGKTPADILAIDAKAVFDRLGLQEALSPQRSNGLYAMVERIRHHAMAAQASPRPGAETPAG
ncbi:MAG: SufE family protein [Alphaproteobacteria bacterium]